MTRRRFAGCVLLLSALCVPSWAQNKKADLTNLVVVGDSLSAGFQNFSLLGTQQPNSYAALIAAQAGTPMVLPLMASPGVPNVLQLISPGPPPVIAPLAGTLPPMPRLRPDLQPTNLAVPGVTIGDVLNKRPGAFGPSAIDAMNTLILGVPSPVIVPGPALTQVERAATLNPTTIIFWAGNNDVLLAALTGDFSLLTQPLSFATSYDQVMQKLTATGATLVVANLPDVTVIPYFTSADTIAAQSGRSVNYVRQALGLNPGDTIRPTAQALVPGILADPQTGPLPTTCPADIPGIPVTQVPCVFRAAQAQTIRTYVTIFNATIFAEAVFRHATLVDIYSLINNVKNNGITANGHHITLGFLGGFASLDGMHPTNTGYAVIANEFIKTMNRELRTGIPPVSVDQVAKNDPLVLP